MSYEIFEVKGFIILQHEYRLPFKNVKIICPKYYDTTEALNYFKRAISDKVYKIFGFVKIHISSIYLLEGDDHDTTFSIEIENVVLR